MSELTRRLVREGIRYGFTRRIRLTRRICFIWIDYHRYTSPTLCLLAVLLCGAFRV